MHSAYTKSTVECYAVLGWGDIGEAAMAAGIGLLPVRFPIVQFSADYSLNAIPTATITLATGLNVKDQKTSPADAILEAVTTLRQKIEIYASNVTDFQELHTLFGFVVSRIPEVPVDTLVFRGYIVGFGYQRSSSACALSVSLEHWLSDLAAASMTSASTHSLTPGDPLRSVLMRQVGEAGGTGIADEPGALMSSGWVFLVAGPMLTANLWEEGIKKLCIAGANSTPLISIDAAAKEAGCPPENDSTALALSALENFTGVLALKASSATVANNIIEEFSNLFLISFAGMTLWDCIVESSSNYMYAIAPGISKSKVVPFLPNIKTRVPFKTIMSYHTASVSISGDAPRILRGVGILVPNKDAFLPDGSPNKAVPSSFMGGIFVTGKCKGTILYRQSPRWLSTSSAIPERLRGVETLSTGLNPAPTGAAAPATAGPDTAKNYAKCVYGYEILKGRQGIITGPFRLDIGVGSYIKFNIPTGNGTDGKFIEMYGMVLKVSLTLNAQSPQASTTFTVGYVRTEKENADGLVVMTEHPLYKDTYSGGAL